MKIVVVSDSHKEFHKLKSVVENNLDADAFIHLGDGEHEFNDVRNLHPEKSFLFVKGNCDFADNTGITLLEIDENGAPTLLCFNDISHLPEEMIQRRHRPYFVLPEVDA